MLRRKLILTGLTMACAVAVAPASGAATAQAASEPKLAETRAALRDLWSEHVVWVRNVVWAELGKNEAATSAAETQVVANARQIANSIAPYHGQAAADQLFELLKGHYGPIRQYLGAVIASDRAKRNAAQEALATNAGQIARFLSTANPYLPYEAVNGLLLAHGGHHVTQIDQLSTDRFSDEAQTWTAMRAHMNTIADAIADALARQFPEKFG